MSDEITAELDFQTICEALIADYDVTYIAVPEQAISNQALVVFYHNPPGSPQIFDKNGKDIPWNPEDDGVQVGEKVLPAQFLHVTYNEIHNYGRIPVYVEEQPGLDDRPLAQGIDTIHAVLNGEVTISQPESKTPSLRQVVTELSEAGAAAVELENQSLIWSDMGLIHLRIPITPADGHSIVGPYDSVTINGKTYEFDYDFVLEGPGGYGRMRTPLYVNDSIRGQPPVSVKEGMNYLHSLLRALEKGKSYGNEHDELDRVCEQWTIW